MIYRIFVILVLVTLHISCNDDSKKELPKEHKVKSVNIQDFNILDISEKAYPDIKKWRAFQVLMQMVVNAAPGKIKNTEKLSLSNPDSVIVYKRLYPKNTKTILESTNVERDWRVSDNGKDTIYRLEKKNNDELSFIQWDNFLVENVPYVFSVFVKELKLFDLTLNFVKDGEVISEDRWIIRNEADSAITKLRKEDLKIKSPDLLTTDGVPTQQTKSIDFKSIPILEIKTEVIPLDNEWREFRLPIIPKESSVYGVRIGFKKDAKNSDAMLFYRPTLQIRAKDFFKMGEFSREIVGQHSSVESSYYSVFFWLRQIEDELKHLLSNSEFPEKINIPSVKARFRLFETQVRELADNVRNNPNFKEENIKQNIAEIGNTLNNIIQRINHAYDSDLHQRMQDINYQIDTTNTNMPNFQKMN